ncbi:MAG TPA: hypothetical protein VGQ62_04205 [Chloroflexota bacterium]|jgi:hypothetical protein|nr:hypothetical protein [Chloroflexota bacterium]
MVLLIHGEAGGWDELIIAAVGLAVLWIAVKLAGRKAADADDDADDEPTIDEPLPKVDEPLPSAPPAPQSTGLSSAPRAGDSVTEQRDPVSPPTTRLG